MIFTQIITDKIYVSSPELQKMLKEVFQAEVTPDGNLYPHRDMMRARNGIFISNYKRYFLSH